MHLGLSGLNMPVEFITTGDGYLLVGGLGGAQLRRLPVVGSDLRAAVGPAWWASLPNMGSRLPRALIERLVDDAAVFPPGLFSPRAVAEHLARTAYREFVGPLLIPATAAAEVRELAGGAHLRVGLTARPGMPVELEPVPQPPPLPAAPSRSPASRSEPGLSGRACWILG